MGNKNKQHNLHLLDGLICQVLEESQLLDNSQLAEDKFGGGDCDGSQPTEDKGGGGDDSGGSAGSSQGETGGSGKTGCCDGIQEEDWLSDGAAQQAHGNGQCDQALERK